MADLRPADWAFQHVVHAGTAAEYGSASGNLVETTTPAPGTLYGRTKLEGTRRLLAAAGTTGLRVTVARLFTVYGPGEHDGRLLPSLLDAQRNGRQVDLTAGLQVRDFTHVDDVTAFLLALAALPAPVGIVNVATGVLTPVRAFAETAAAVIGLAPPAMRFGSLPTRPEEMHHDPVCVEKLRGLVGRVPGIGIREGVSLTMKEVG
jgi:nucleoside-diphosphate-sugar epimerase